MKYTSLFHPSVQADYNEAYSWYESKQAGLGEKFAGAVRSKIIAILERPESYGSTINKKYREAKLDVFPFIIVFMVHKRKKEIMVASIHHTKKHPKKKYRS